MKDTLEHLIEIGEDMSSDYVIDLYLKIKSAIVIGEFKSNFHKSDDQEPESDLFKTVFIHGISDHLDEKFSKEISEANKEFFDGEIDMNSLRERAEASVWVNAKQKYRIREN